MATELDNEALPLVLETLAEFGKAVVIKIYPSASYSPSTGSTTPGTAIQYNKKIIPPYPYENKYIDGDIIREGDLQSGIAASGLEFSLEKPDLTRFVIDGFEWLVISAKPVYSGDSIAMYQLHLRKVGTT